MVGERLQKYSLINFNPLTTKAKSYSELPEIFTTDSSNFLTHQRLKLFFLPIFLFFSNFAPIRLQIKDQEKNNFFLMGSAFFGYGQKRLFRCYRVRIVNFFIS